MHIRTTVALAAALTTGASGWALAQERFPSEAGPLQVDTVASGLQNPWGLAFLPDGRMLVTERAGRMRIVATNGTLGQPLAGVPQVAARNQGGLLDVVVDPNFASNRMVYFCYSEPRPNNTNGTSVARARLAEGESRLDSVNVIFRQDPSFSGGHHFGCRIVFDRSGSMFVTLGDRYSLKDQAQDPSNHIGKIVHIRPDGSPASGNPGTAGWAREVWSVGHRNIQGAALNPVSGKLWTAEHGARGGDEINIPAAGRNYGWPVITYGRDYSGAKIGEGTAKPGLEQPVFHWDPSIAPSGMAFYTGDVMPAWRGSVFVGGLAGQMLARLVLDGERVVREERLLTGMRERIRDVRQGPDGYLYLLADTSGRVLRLGPARSS